MDFYLAVIRFSHGMSWERYGDFMKQKLFKKLACLALSGILSVSGVEIPAYASERLIMEEKTEIQTETTAEGTTETTTETSGESTETEVVPTETSDESTETEIISTEISDESTETEIISTETSGESRETEVVPTETSDESRETEVVPTETSDESAESETLEEETTETATDEETTETATDEETTETETEMVEKMTARAEDGDVPTPQEAYEAMIALQEKFPEGMHWTDASSGTYTWKGGRGENGEIATMGTGCVNFAFQLSDAAFGTLPARMLKENEFEFADINVGDILRISLGHSVIVLQVNDDSMVIAEGNYNQSIHWGRVVTKSEVEQSVHVLTRYPKGYIPPNNPDANDVIGEGPIQDDEGNPSGLQWKLTKSGTLTISGNGDMPDFNFGNPSVSNRPWNDNIGSIQKIIIEDGVTSIGSNAFRKCDVYSVSIPKSVKKIGNNAFRECRKISYVYLEGVVTIGERAFQSCDNIRGVTLPACIKEIGSAAFFQCQELVSVGFDPKTQSVTVGDDIFNSCWRLMDVTLPKTMNQIGKNMFYSCMALPGLIIPEGVTSIGEGAFTNCSYMTTVFIPKSVKQIGIAAFAKSGLTTVYYGGSEAEWKNIQKIGDTAATLSNVTLFCDIDPEPRLTPDTKTVYKVGEAFDKDGSCVNIATKTISLSDKDVTGFDSKQEGVTTIAVTLGKDIYEFDLLVVEEPSLTAKQGQKLEELTLPSNDYGTWSWLEDNKQTELTETGSKDYPIIFTPKDTEKFSVREDLQAHIQVRSETDPDPSVEIHLKRPSKTTYKLKEELDVSGGEITYGETGETPIPLTKEMTSGFDSDKQGISTVTVTHNENTATFDTLVVEEPSLTAKQGQKLEELTLPSNNYGTWSWPEDSKQTELTETGSKDYPIIFTPKDTEKFSVREDLQAHIQVRSETDPDPSVEIHLKRPSKTTYKLKEELDVSGGEITYGETGETPIPLTKEMTSGFDSDKQGISTVTVTHNENTATFDTLVVEEPSLTAKQGQKLEELTLPSNDYGTWSWLEDNKQTELTETGSKVYPIIFTPKDMEKFSVREDLQAHIKVQTTDQNPGNPEGGLWIAPIAACTYTGIAVTPSVNVFYNNKELTAGIDYTISYQNNIKAATSDAQKAPAVIVKGKGTYSGTKKETFTINKLELTKDHLKIAANYPKKIKYTPIVTNDSNNILKAGRDYTLTYQDSSGKPLNKQPTTEGNYLIQIQGTGSCEGDFRCSYSISESGGATAINKGRAEIGSFTYGNGEPKVSLAVNGNNLISGTDYIVNFVNVGKKGTATATFIGIGNYTGTLKKNFKVQAAPIQENDIRVPKTAAYAKGGAKPNVTVTVNGRSLVMNTDYTVSYKNNTKVGNTAKVVIKGKGNYSGSVTKMFSIEQQSLRAENIKIYVSDAQTGKNPAVTVYDANGKKLTANSDYRTEIDKKEHKVTITPGKNGLYKDSVDKDYRELPKKQLVTSVTLKKTQPKSFAYTGEEIKLEQDWLTVKAGKTELKKNEFEIIGYVNNIQKGTATVIIKGCGEYGGIKMYNYKITAKNLSQK